MKKTILLLTLAVLCFTVGFGQKRFDVSLIVQSQDKDIQSQVESYIARELRGLNDVEIKNEAFQELRIIVIENRNQRGDKTGYTLSAVVNWRGECISVDRKTIYPCYIFDDHLLYIAPLNDLRKACEHIVTDFDTRSLKPLRR